MVTAAYNRKLLHIPADHEIMYGADVTLMVRADYAEALRGDETTYVATLLVGEQGRSLTAGEVFDLLQMLKIIDQYRSNVDQVAGIARDLYEG